MTQPQNNTQRRVARSSRIIPARRGRGRLRARAGFTLVEMLVSTALIVIVMLMFAQVYQVAASSVGTQKGIVENDQRSRTLTTVINNDVKARTFRFVLPVHPKLEPVAFTNLSDRAGYFSISENDPLDDADDGLSFTVRLETDDAPLTGRATKFDQPPLGLGPPNDNTLDQPEADDGQVDFAAGAPVVRQDSTGASRFAEICYFVRNGNLYRRVHLIRDPYDDAAAAQPAAFPATDYPAAPPGPFPSSFWHDFDYSAFYLTGTGPQFHNSSGDLNNDMASSPTSFGHPRFRFGHDHLSGNPREYVNQPAGTPLSQLFIGRFTQQETSHPEFGYPGRIPDLDGDAAFNNSPFDAATPTNLGLFNGIVSYQPGVDGNFGTSDDVQFTGPRRGEDILLSHVHSFDVKVFDQAYDETGGSDMNRNGKIDVPADGGAFADVGHTAAGGDYRYSWNRCPGYGPRIPEAGADGLPGVAGFDDNGDGTTDTVAERGWPGSDDGRGPDGQPGVGGIDDDGINGVDDAGELGWPGSDDNVNRVFDTWHYLMDFDGGPIPVPGQEDSPPFWAPGGTTVWAPGAPYALNDFVVPINANWTGFVYRCVAAGTSGAAEPLPWPTIVGSTVVDNGVTWRCEPLRPLKAIQITIRFLDTASGQMRQVTLVESLVD